MASPTSGSFGGIKPPSHVMFDVAISDKNKNGFFAHGEAGNLEYEGQNNLDTDEFYVALYDPETESIDLSSAPLLSIRSMVVSKRKEDENRLAANKERTAAMIQRQALGEAFGTKRAKKQLNDLKKNRIEAENLKDFESAIVEDVKHSTASLPTPQAISEQHDIERPIPKPNMDAATVDDVYPIDSVISDQEWAAMRLGPILKEKDPNKKAEMLPYKDSHYVSGALSAIESEDQMSKLKLLYYISLLMGFYHNRRASNKKVLQSKLKNVPEILVDGILKRYTQVRGGTNVGKSKAFNFIVDPKNEDKLLCHMLALCLRLDNYVVETLPLAQELSLKPMKLNALFKALGCNVKNCTSTQREALGLNSAEAANWKLATLTLPFKLPPPPRRRR